MRSRKLILQKMKLFYDEVKEKRENKLMRLQVDNEFQQVKIHDLNDQNNVEMFTTSIRGGKAFAAEQKIRELKTRVGKLKIQKLEISSTKIILKSAANMNNLLNEKYGLPPEEIETRSLSDERFRALFNFHRIEKTRQVHERLNRYDKKMQVQKKKTKRQIKCWWKSTGLSWMNKKKFAPGKSYKQLVQNVAYFNRDEIFSIRKRQTVDKIDYYWLKNLRNNKVLMKKFQRIELFSVELIL